MSTNEILLERLERIEQLLNRTIPCNKRNVKPERSSPVSRHQPESPLQINVAKTDSALLSAR